MPTAVMIQDGLQVFLTHLEKHFANHRNFLPWCSSQGVDDVRIRGEYVDLMTTRRKNAKDACLDRSGVRDQFRPGLSNLYSLIANWLIGTFRASQGVGATRRTGTGLDGLLAVN
jgi:hypothetical protein